MQPASRTLEPKWREQFDMHIYDEEQQMLEIMVYDKRTAMFMGRWATLATLSRLDV